MLTFLERNAPAGSVIGGPSFADALAALLRADDLDAATKRHWATSLRQMAGFLGRPCETIPARVTGISRAVQTLHPEQLNVHPKTFANHRANVKRALNWYGRTEFGNAHRAPMSDAWRELWSLVPDVQAKDMLSPFCRFLSGLGIAPSEVADVHVKAYATYRLETSFSPLNTSSRRLLVRYWNKAVDEVPGWPTMRLAEPGYAERSSGPRWDQFPEELREGIEIYLADLSRPHKASDGRRMKGCKPSTVDTRKRELVAAVRTAVASGIELDRLTSLAALLHPDTVEAIVDHLWEAAGDVPSTYAIALAGKLHGIARALPGFDAGQLGRLDDLRYTMEQHRQGGMTKKNRDLIRQVLVGDIWDKVIQLPMRLMAIARSESKAQPIKAAVLAQLATAIAILVVAPIRVGNLASIQIGENLVRPAGPGTPITLVFEGYDVKNGIDLEHPLPARVTAIIDEYIHLHRPALMRGRNHDYLFPGEGRDQKTSHTLSEQMSVLLWKHLGLKVTAHQFRHAAAAIILEKLPGNYEMVRRVLGHRNLRTTTNSYVGLDTINASRMYADLVIDKMGK
ncbi:integrase [Rhodoligotrophos appendicifer]|uniref:tyrosine-type recombinase/integrase n=1 Tax=Rhodoligotrophos appendicifer TaxID=987056 RepID=UPI00147872D1|nr:tyrosine-type recombinase/integrase [Rhodoligotrophos appendicifer]